MIKTLETARLLMRPFTHDDVQNLYLLDSNPEVHRYLGNNPVTTHEQVANVIDSVLNQYQQHNIGRWITIEKQSGAFIGWSGLKWITEPENSKQYYYDVGYRFIPEYWGKGYATEAATAALHYGFTELGPHEIIGTVHQQNKASRRVLEKCGLQYEGPFMWHDLACDWLSITRQRWQELTYLHEAPPLIFP